MNTKILMTHFYYGDISPEFSQKLAIALVNSGADILEIGIPYSDPVCDGEVFQRSCQRALENGITPFKVLAGIKNIRNLGIKNPIYLTSYYGPIFKIGIQKFTKMAKEAGINGLIVPDLLLEEQGELRKFCNKYRLSLIQFATVYSSGSRLKQIIRTSTGFIYCVSLPGVTGDSVGEKNKLSELLKLLKSMTEKKLFVGFGIKSKEDAKDNINLGADGVIVGSAIAQIYKRNLNNPEETLPGIAAFIKSLKACTIKGKTKQIKQKYFYD